MKPLTRRSIILIAAVAALIIEAIVCLAWQNTPASHSPSIFFLFHFLGISLAEPMHFGDTADLVFIGCTGALQFFVLFWSGLTIWRRMYERQDA